MEPPGTAEIDERNWRINDADQFANFLEPYRDETWLPVKAEFAQLIARIAVRDSDGGLLFCPANPETAEIGERNWRLNHARQFANFDMMYPSDYSFVRIAAAWR